MGPVSSWNPESVYPAARFSDRVFFGTGPALSKAASGDLSSYPIYHHSLFAKVAATYSLTDELYHHDLHSEFLDFLQQQFNQSDLWSTIRNNVKDANQFRRAFHEKADGLRILQFLKQKQKAEPIPDMQSLRENLMLFLTDARCAEEAAKGLEKALPEIQAANDITSLSTATLAILRDTLRNMEMALRHTLA